MQIFRQILETKDLRFWVTHTAALLEQSEDLLNDLNTFPVPNFNTGTNLAASWSRIAAMANTLSPALPPGQFMAHLASAAQKFPRGSSGMFTAAALAAGAKTWRESPQIRPLDLVKAVQTIASDFQSLDGDVSLDFGLTALAQSIVTELSELELYTLSAVLDTAVVCAQQLAVDSADAHSGVGDAGLSGACLVLASLADVVARVAGETPGNIEVIQAMLSDWADRSRTVAQTRRSQTPAEEFEVTFHHTGYAADIEKRRQELAATCSEVLVTGASDELGFGSFTTHVHTAMPLSTLPSTSQNILVEQLSPPERAARWVAAEDPLPEMDNVVLLAGGSNGQENAHSWCHAQILVLSAAPALVEMYARGSATVLLNPSGTEWIQWALGAPRELSVLLPSSPATQELARKMSPHETANLIIAPSQDELTALWLAAGLAAWEYHRDADAKSLVEREIQRWCGLMRVEEMGEDLESQLEVLRAFVPGETTEIMALIGANQPSVDRVKLRSIAEVDPQIELTIFYGGQRGPTLLGVQDDTARGES